MAQVSYGTITITDTNDIETIGVEYNKNQSTTTPPLPSDTGWSTNRPEWEQGYYIWQRTRTHKAGTDPSTDTYGTAVCITGSTGSTGATGDAGRSLTDTETKYTNVASGTTQTQVEALPESAWFNNVPSYDSSKPDYWVRVKNTYSNPSSTQYIFYKDNGITDAIATAVSAEYLASQASQDASAARQEVALLGGHFIYKGSSSGQSTNPGAGVIQNATDSPGGWGYNTWIGSNGIQLRIGETVLSQWISNGINFYNPTSHEADVILNSNGLNIKNGFIQLGGTDASGTASGNIRLANTDFNRSINEIPRTNLRLAIGSNFGVKNDGTLYASNANVEGAITVGVGSNVYTTNESDDLIYGTTTYEYRHDGSIEIVYRREDGTYYYVDNSSSPPTEVSVNESDLETTDDEQGNPILVTHRLEDGINAHITEVQNNINRTIESNNEDIRSEISSVDEKIDSQQTAINNVSTTANNALSGYNDLSGRMSQVEKKTDRIIISTNPAMISIITNQNALNLTASQLQIAIDGTVASWFAGEGAYNKKIYVSEIYPRYLSGDITNIGAKGGFGWIARNNGNLSLKIIRTENNNG